MEGEKPNPTDSGYLMSRCGRRILEGGDSQIAHPTAALPQYITAGKTIVFIDDFVGTGNQMRSTWHRPYATGDPKSFAHAFSSIKRDCYYVCLTCSAEGRQILSQLSGLEVIPAHDLEERDRFRASLGRIPDHPAGSGLQAAVSALLAKYANDLILPQYMTAGTFPRQGFANLGLTLGFQHSIPDATLPIYWASGTGSWTRMGKRP